MSKPSQRKREKQRKREAKRQRRLTEPVSLAYTGNKYKTNELIPFHFATETAIYECFVLTRRRLTDHHVRAAVEWLIAELRRGPLPEWDAGNTLTLTAGGEADLIVANIRRSWCMYAEENPRPGRDNVIGVLRTILGSIECWGSIGPESRGYLKFIEGLCNKLGVRVTLAPAPPPEMEVLPELPLPERIPFSP